MSKAGTISSAANPLLKDVRRAILRGGLTSHGWCVAESFHLLDEALRSRCEVKTVLASESARAEAESHARGLADVKIVPDALFERLASTETSQGAIALVQPPAWTLDRLFEGRPLVVVLDGLQDPGNAGAIVRAAEAFGATGAMFLKGTASPFNTKTLRASAGSLFRVPFVHGLEAAAALAALDRYGVEPFAAVSGAARSVADVDLTRPCALAIGNEARGVGEPWRSRAAEISIPTAGVESLNAALAAGILLYEARRQRTPRP